MHSIRVRQAVFADLTSLSKLFDQYRVFQGRPSDREAAEAFLKARFDHGESIVFLAEEEATQVGFAQIFPIYSSVSLARVYILNDLFVAPVARRRGVGAKLLAGIENYAWSNHAARISLNVAQGNTAGQALYERTGWCKDADFFMYHRRPSDK